MVLTGSSGAVYVTPAGTKACLLAADFDDTGDTIQVEAKNDFIVGDRVQFQTVDGATLDTGVDDTTNYRITAISPDFKVTIVKHSDSSAVTIAGDGVDNGGHVEMFYAPVSGCCECREWSIDYSRDELDSTTLPCTVGAQAGSRKWASGKRMTPGLYTATGTMTLYLTDNDTAISTRLMRSVHLNTQDGAFLKLYWDAISDGGSEPKPDDTTSRYVAGDVTFTAFSSGVNPDDPAQAEVTFNMYNITRWIDADC